MKNFYKIPLTFIFLISATLTYGSNISVTVKGLVIDSLSGKPMEYATVTVSDSNGTGKYAEVTNSKGRFEIKVKEAGEYTLNVIYLGYATYAESLNIASGDNIIELETISLAESAETIDEIVVSAIAPLIRVEPDKMVYNLESDPEAEYGTLAEIIKKVPQLSIDGEGKVLLNGQSNYQVLVNGKTSGMMSKNFNEVIKSMPASSIKEIEVITNPSTKYDAAGVGGIINIITDKRRIDGYSGRVNYGMSFPNTTYNAGAYISAQINKFTISASYNLNTRSDFTYRSNHEFTNWGSTPPYKMMTEITGDEIKYQSQFGGIEASYELDSLNLFSLSFNLYSHESDDIYTHNTSYFNLDGLLLNKYVQTQRASDSYLTPTVGFDYQRSFQKPGRLFTVSYLFDYTRDYYRYNTSDNSTGPVLNERKLNNNEFGQEHTLQLDYYDPLNEKHVIEGGLKYIFRQFGTDSEATRKVNDDWVSDLDLINTIDYDQHIFAVYAGYLFRHDKFTAKAGLRGEGTLNIGSANNKGTINDFRASQFDVVPYFNISYLINPMQRLSLSYTQRLSRPSIWYQNPAKIEQSPGIFNYGNPDLDATKSHSASLGYSFFSSAHYVSVNVNGGITNNSITNYSFVDEESGNMHSSFFNIGKSQYVSMGASYNFRYSTILNLYLSGAGSYSNYEINPAGLPESVNSIEPKSGFTYYFNAGGNVKLWKNATFYASVYYSSPWFSYQSESQRANTYTNFGLTQRLFNEKLDINIYVSNPFRKNMIYESISEIPGQFHMSGQTIYPRRSFGFYVGYRFGKMDINVKKASRKISNDDMMSKEN